MNEKLVPWSINNNAWPPCHHVTGSHTFERCFARCIWRSRRERRRDQETHLIGLLTIQTESNISLAVHYCSVIKHILVIIIYIITFIHHSYNKITPRKPTFATASFAGLREVEENGEGRTFSPLSWLQSCHPHLNISNRGILIHFKKNCLE